MEKLSYTLVRSKRKTLAVYVLPDARIEARAPLRMPISTIEAFLDSRREWIEGHLETARLKQREKENYSAADGQTILFLGKEYPIHLDLCNDVQVKDDCFILPQDERERKAALTRWYCKKAVEILPLLAEKQKNFTGINWKKLTIGSAASRWGSCNGKNEIRLSWRLILLPTKLVEYVIIHELCHIPEHNHSAAFWKRVESFLPNYMELRKELRKTERDYFCQINWLN